MKEYATYSSPNDIRIHANSVQAFHTILDYAVLAMDELQNKYLDPDNDTE